MGITFTGIGIIGIVVPLLPTTPFILLAAYCFNRGSEKMRKWFKNNKLLTSYIENYRSRKGITLKAKMISIAMLWITIGISIYFAPNIYLRLILATIIIGVTIHLVKIPTYKK